MTTNINIRVDNKLKNEAESLFKDLGITMSSAITMFLKMAIKEDGIPFKINRNLYNTETISALNEYQDMKDKKEYKRYSSFKQLLGDIDNA